MMLTLIFLLYLHLIKSYTQVRLKQSCGLRRNVINRISYFQQLYLPVAVKQSSYGIDDHLNRDTGSPEDTLSSQSLGEDDLLSKEMDTFQDYSKFSTESFTALKGLATASLAIILSANTALFNATTEVIDSSKRGQNLWLIDTETRTTRSGENSTAVSIRYVNDI